MTEHGYKFKEKQKLPSAPCNMESEIFHCACTLTEAKTEKKVLSHTSFIV